MRAATRSIPVFRARGLFYLWEVAIGTNPKIMRPSGIERHSSGGFEWERRRSGVIHMGFGTLVALAGGKMGRRERHPLRPSAYSSPVSHLHDHDQGRQGIHDHPRRQAHRARRSRSAQARRKVRRSATISCAKTGSRRFPALPAPVPTKTMRATRASGSTRKAEDRG